MRTAIIVLALLLGGCAYYSKTDIHIQADEAQYPLGITAIKLKRGIIDVHREMETKGLRNDSPSIVNSCGPISDPGVGGQ